MGTVLALAGQVGGAKLAEGLYRLRGRQLTVLVNTGDDYEHLGLSFSPDVDSVLYALAGLASATAGWEPEGETRALHEMLKRLGGPDRPLVGDKALAAPLLRTQGLAAGRSATAITLDFCRALGVQARVLPMTNDRVRTYVLTDEGAVTFPEYYNELGCAPTCRGFEYAGAEAARLPDEALDALHAANLEAVVITPSNPYHAIRPILAVGGMQALLRKRGAPVIAVSPIVGDKAVRGSAGKLMRDLGREPSPLAIAAEYRQLIDGFVIDRADSDLAFSIRSLGIKVLATNTVMRSAEDRFALAMDVLGFAGQIRESDN